MDRPGFRQVPEGSGEQGKMEKTVCEIICSAPTTLAVKGWMMMMISACCLVCMPVYIWKRNRQAHPPVCLSVSQVICLLA